MQACAFFILQLSTVPIVVSVAVINCATLYIYLIIDIILFVIWEIWIIH